MATEEPIQPEVAEIMRDIARTISSVTPEGHGFALLMFTIGHGGHMNYISNANRDDMIVAMKEFIASCEGRMPDVPETRQ